MQLEIENYVVRHFFALSNLERLMLGVSFATDQRDRAASSSQGGVFESIWLGLELIAYRLKCYFLTRPYPLMVVFAIVRRVRSIAVIGSVVLVSKAKDVREVLGRLNDFNVSELLGPAMPWGPLLLSLDWLEQHDRERTLLQSVVFPAEDIAAVRKMVADRCRDVIARKGSAGELDMVTDVAEEAVIEVLKRYFGIPMVGGIPDMAAILGDVSGFILVQPPARSQRHARAYANMARLTNAILDRIEEEKKKLSADPKLDPMDDLLIRLTKRSCQKGHRDWLNDDWIRRYVTGLAATGGGTIVHATSHAMDRLIAHRDGMAAAQELARRLEGAYDQTAWGELRQIVFEALRFRPMLPLLVRYNPRETIIAKGTPRARIAPAGATVLAPPIAAMFDPEPFEKPWRFVVGRPVENYIHFGSGPRTCFGKYVAEVVMVEIIRSLLLLPNLKRARGGAGRLHYNGPVVSSLRLRFDPSAAGGKGKNPGAPA